MKNLITLAFSVLFFFTFTSCNDRLEGDEIQNIDAAKIDSVKIVNFTMDVYTTQTIKTYSNYAQNCEGFYGYDYLHTAPLERKVITYKFKTDVNCGELQPRFSQINFRPQEVGTYTFKFYTGKDAAGVNTYLEKQIVVK